MRFIRLVLGLYWDTSVSNSKAFFQDFSRFFTIPGHYKFAAVEEWLGGTAEEKE
jgi:hypothetical protein